MKRLLLALCALSLVPASSASPANLQPASTEQEPVRLLSDMLHSFYYEYTETERIRPHRKDDGFDNNTFCHGTPIWFSWTGTTGACTVRLRRLSDIVDLWTATTDTNAIEVVNLELGTGYKWTVTDSAGESASAVFYTSPEPPRLIKMGTMKVMRDLGGWIGLNNCPIRQNQIFRGGPANNGKPDDAARTFFYDIVGVKTEIDFRRQDERGLNPAFDGTRQIISYHLLPIEPYAFYKPEKTKSGTGKNFAETLKLLMTATNRPAYFHCQIGRDRTGSMASIVLAALGVSEEDIMKDFQTSYYGDNDSPTDSIRSYLGKFKNFCSETYGADLTLAEWTKRYCIDIGISAEQVEAFRKDMLIGYGYARPYVHATWSKGETTYRRVDSGGAGE